MNVRKPGAASDPGTCLARRIAEHEGPVERRHEELMEWAESELGLDRGYAERIHVLAEEEGLAPLHAFMLIGCGVGVQELEPPEADGDEAAQQVPPGWSGNAGVELDDVDLERRLRASFRRFRSHLQSCASADEAVAAFLAEPDVGATRLR